MKKKKKGQQKATEGQYWLYSTGNFANNIIYLMVATYITYFYTNILGISAFMAGVVFMVARLVDAFTDPLMGMIVDRTNTKMGKYRPWIIAGAPFLGIMFVLLFTAPNFSTTGKIAYAFLTYIIYSIAWTIVQIPQLALPAILSNDLAVRTRIQTIFQMVGSFAAIFSTSFTLPILDMLGGQNNASAWFKFTVIFGIIATVVFILSAQSVRNIDVYDPQEAKRRVEHKESFKETISVVTKNGALVCVLIAFGTDQFAYQISNSLRVYFFTYNMNGRTDLITYLGLASMFVGIAVVLFIQPFVRKTGKKWGIAIIEAMAIVFALPMLITGLQGAYAVGMVMFSYITLTFTTSISNTLCRAAVLDSANYAQLKTGVNGTALVNSTFTFVNKCCQAFSAFFGGAILSATGYNAALEQQTPGCLKAILLLCTVVPIAGYIASVVAMYFYPISKAGEAKIQEELDKLDAANASNMEADPAVQA